MKESWWAFARRMWLKLHAPSLSERRRAAVRGALLGGEKHSYELGQIFRNSDLGEGWLYRTLNIMVENGEIHTETREEQGRLRRYYALMTAPNNWLVKVEKLDR